MKTYETAIRERIRTVRIEEKISQQGAAELLTDWGYSMGHGAYRNMESVKGRGVTISKKLIKGLAEVFNCCIEDLVQEPGVWELLPDEPQRAGRQFKTVRTCPNCDHTW